MKSFIKYIIGWFILMIILLEVTLRIFGLAASTIPTENVDNNYLLAPSESGYWIRGGLGEISNYYQINKQGFNSIIDFEHLDSTKINIALIGDSYIQGFQTDVRKSIGRQLEQILGSNVVVHEYGRAGGNIVDFGLVYKKYINDRNYDFTFILATDKDLMEFKASFMDRGNRVSKSSLSRKIYDNIHLIRYLNINHGLGVHFNELISKGPSSIERIHSTADTDLNLDKETYLMQINSEAINLLPKSVIFLYENDNLSHHFKENFEFNFQKIEHKILPKDHGFDQHWNENGRFNCASAMAEYIKSNMNEN